MNFDAVFEQHTRPAPAKSTQKSQACITRCAVHVRCFCARSLRVARSFCTKIAPFFGRKPRDFRVEIFENQRDRSHRCTQNADNTLEQSFDACFAGPAGLHELCSALCTEICAKTSRFSLEIAKVPMKLAAVFAHHTRPALAKNAQKSQAYVTRYAVHVRCFCARSSRVARSFCTKIAQFFDRKPRDCCVEKFENQRDCSRRCTQNTDKTSEQSFHA